MSTEEMAECGGWTIESPVTPEVKEICMKVKPEIENKTGTMFQAYKPFSFRYEMAKTKYLIKVYVGVQEFVHALIFAAGGELTVTRVEYPKAIIDPLVPL